MTSFAVAPAPVKKIISSIKKKEIQLLELKSEMERKKSNKNSMNLMILT